jgi:hypothetical protein
MTAPKRTLSAGVAVALLLAGLAVNSRGEVDGGLGFSPNSELTMQIHGNVVCTECSLEEAQKARPHDTALYQMTSRQGRLVMQVNWVSNTARWSRIVWPPQLRVRGDAHLIHQLGAEENLFKEVEITGLLSNTRTLDLLMVNAQG